MPNFRFHMGVTLRCYGNVDVTADTIEAALPLLTADYVGEHIEITETTTDSGQDLAVIDVSDADTGAELADYGGHSLPSPYDPPPGHAEMLAVLKDILGQVDLKPERLPGALHLWEAARAAVTIAEGRADD